MKIVAYSKVPAVIPFVHLGYLSASTTTTKPIQGLLFGGVVLLVAAVSLSGKWLWQHRKSVETIKTQGFRMPMHAVIKYALFLLAIVVISSAYMFGERETRYAYPKEATLHHISVIEARITRAKELDNDGGQVTALPTQEGEYDVHAVIDIPADSRRLYQKRRICFDAWSMPLRLLVAQGNGELKYTVVSAGPDRIMGTPDDITSAKARDD